jgi:hypothetical protein
LKVTQSVLQWSEFLIPKVAQEGDAMVFPALCPNIARDVSLVADIKFALVLAVYHLYLSTYHVHVVTNNL